MDQTPGAIRRRRRRWAKDIFRPGIGPLWFSETGWDFIEIPRWTRPLRTRKEDAGRGRQLIDKRVTSFEQALAGIEDGSTILVSGFGNAGSPIELLEALVDQGARDLTVVSNNAGEGEFGLAALMRAGRVRKIICSYPITSGSVVVDELHAAGKIELEVAPQGTISERMRAAAAGIGGFYTRTSAGTRLGEGKETREFDGHPHVLERPLKGDVALLRAKTGDRWGNLVYNMTARNFGPTVAMAADLTIAQVDETVDAGELDPEIIVTPGIFVDRVLRVPRRA